MSSVRQRFDAALQAIQEQIESLRAQLHQLNEEEQRVTASSISKRSALPPATTSFSKDKSSVIDNSSAVVPPVPRYERADDDEGSKYGFGGADRMSFLSNASSTVHKQSKMSFS